MSLLNDYKKLAKMDNNQRTQSEAIKMLMSKITERDVYISKFKILIQNVIDDKTDKEQLNSLLKDMKKSFPNL